MRKKFEMIFRITAPITLVENHLIVIFIRADRMLHRLPLKDIVYIEALENYVMITTVSERLTTRSTLKDMLSQLPEKDFLRVHKSFAVNASYISSVGRIHIIMKIGSKEIPLSRSYRDIIKSLR